MRTRSTRWQITIAGGGGGGGGGDPRRSHAVSAPTDQDASQLYLIPYHGRGGGGGWGGGGGGGGGAGAE